MEFNSIIAALFFYIFPILIGRPIARFFIKRELAIPFISYFLTGIFTLFASTAAANFIFCTLLNLPFLPVFQAVILLLALILVPVNIILTREDLKIKSYIVPFLTSVLLAAFVFILFSYKSPYPLNWDLYEHQTLTQNILAGRFSLIPSHITDTFGFNGYSTIFHTLLAAPQAFIKVSVLPLWNALNFFHLILVTFATFLLGKSVSGKNSIGYLSAIFGGIIFDSLISFTNLFLMPQTATAVIFIFLFVQLIESFKKGHGLALRFIIANTFAIFLNHFIVGAAAAGLYLTSSLYLKFESTIKEKINLRVVAEVMLVAMIIAILFSQFIPLGFINSGEGNAFNLSIFDKFEAMRQAYGFLPLFLFPLGMILVLKGKRKFEILTALMAVFLLSGMLTQLPYVMKFFVLAKFFASVILALGVYRIISNISNKITYAASYVLLLAALTILFITNTTVWKGILQYEGLNTQVSAYEIAAAQFLKKHYSGKNAMLVSDPATQNILEPLSTVNSQGGVYMDLVSRKKLSTLKSTNDGSMVVSTLAQINDKITPRASVKLLILGGRYFEWQKAAEYQKMAFSYNTWSPVDLSLSDIEQINTLLASSNRLKLVYKNPGVTIIEVNYGDLK